MPQDKKLRIYYFKNALAWMNASTILDATRAWETATGQVECVFVT